jgi:hypothetical protein
MAALISEFGEEGLVTFAINSNDFEAHPEDAPPAWRRKPSLEATDSPT